MNDRDLLALIHGKAAMLLAAEKVPSGDDPLFDGMEEIWKLTRDAWEGVHGPSGDDGRDFTAPYEP